jgi:hypothetical protein
MKIVQPILYENYVQQQIKLYRNLDVNLSFQWTNRLPRKKRRRRRSKPANFKIFYKRLFFLKNNIKANTNLVCKFSIPLKSKVVSQSKFHIVSNQSYYLRALNNSLIYRKHNLQFYKYIKIKGFTFNKEKIFDFQRLPNVEKEGFFSDFIHKQNSKNKNF